MRTKAKKIRAPTIKVQPLTIFLLKESVASFGEAILDASKLTRHELVPGMGLAGCLYVKVPKTRQSSWRAFVEPAIGTALEHCVSSSASAVLVVLVDERYLAITFGHGRFLLNLDLAEHNFGLRVVLNAVNPNQLQSVDSKVIEDQTMLTRRQISTDAPLESFGLDISRDLLRAVGGRPRDATFAVRVAGAQALALAARITISGLAETCKKAIKLYAATSYKKRFSWIDDLKPVQDASLVGALDAQLASELRANLSPAAHLAAPELVDWSDSGGFQFVGPGRRSKETMPDLELGEYLTKLGAKRSKLQPAMLRQHAVLMIGQSNDQELHRWSVYKCLVAEVLHAGSQYVLTGGEWYVVSNGLVGRVDRFLAELKAPATALPAAIRGESEEKYNARAARGNTGLALLDRKLVKAELAATTIEACDLLSSAREFFHVKISSRSSTLSHLLAQGIVGAESFVSDEGFRRALRKHLKRIRKSMVALVPIKRPKASKYVIVYAIIGDTSRELPFFTKLHLMQTGRRLLDLGFRVALQRVPWA